MKRLHVSTPDKDYEIVFNTSFGYLTEEILNLKAKYSKVAVITEDQVASYYLEPVLNELNKSFQHVSHHVFQHGESQKHLGTVSELYTFMIEQKLDRKSLVIALGGGVTGDMVGFAASTYMRGIPFIQLPTSLLSQVDSSIGGKTGVDFLGYKNIVGAFYQPELVYINTKTLSTLTKSELYSGMGEVIKHGYIADMSYLDFLEKNVDGIKALDDVLLAELIYRSCDIKSKVVSQDEKENGIRAILNFGHTAGHAIERLKEFKLFHGECVAIGMMVAFHICGAMGLMSEDEISRGQHLLELYELPVTVEGLMAEDIYQDLFLDKKTTHDSINFVLLDHVGSAYIHNGLSRDILIHAINKVLI